LVRRGAGREKTTFGCRNKEVNRLIVVLPIEKQSAIEAEAITVTGARIERLHMPRRVKTFLRVAEQCRSR